ncbi:hypothetical protein FKM82_006512 [Ascaphus truei]
MVTTPLKKLRARLQNLTACVSCPRAFHQLDQMLGQLRMRIDTISYTVPAVRASNLSSWAINLLYEMCFVKRHCLTLGIAACSTIGQRLMSFSPVPPCGEARERIFTSRIS